MKTLRRFRLNSGANMSQRVNRTLLIGSLIAVLLGVVSVASCGGGASGGTTPPPPPPAGDFSLTFEAPNVTIQQGGASQAQNIQVQLLNGLTGTIVLTVTGLPAGVTSDPPGPFSVSSSSASSLGTLDVGFQMNAATSAAAASPTITVTGTVGAITHSATFQLTVTPVAPFSIQVSPPSLSLTPGTSGTVQVSVTPSPGTSPQLSVTISELPNNSGINMSLPQSFLTPTNPVSFFINPTPLAQPLQNFPVVITASDSQGNSTVFTLPLTVSIPFSSNATRTRSTFARTDQGPTSMVYDQTRKLVFVCVEILNEIAVFSSVDGHKVASIPVNYPSSIDEASDGSAVYVVSPYFSGVTTIDPNLFQVVGHANVPPSVSGSSQGTTFFQLAALSTGSVLLSPSGDFVDLSKPPLFLWDPKTNTFTRVGQTTIGQVGVILRSSDYSTVLVNTGNGGVLFNATTQTFTGPNSSVGANSVISPDGSRIVSVGLQNSPTVLLDNNFNTIATLQLDAFPLTGVVYSLDGRHVYVFTQQIGSSGGNIATVIDTQTFSVVGVVPGFSFGVMLPFSGQWITTFATDETNMLFGAAFGGVGFLDMSSPTFLQQPLPGSFQVQPALASLSSPTQVQLDGAGFSQNPVLNLFVGAPPASSASLKATNVSVQSTNFLNATIPTGTAAGSANATLTRSDGFFEVMPDAVTFGPTIIRVDGDSGSPAGGDSIRIFGYGFDSSSTQVTIGGQAATVGQIHGAVSDELFPTNFIDVTTPSGTSGKADVVVTTPAGSASVSGGFHYLDSAQIYPIVGALDALTYDQPRQRLYITNQDHSRIEIFNLATNTFLSPVTVGNAPTALALTPDGNLLAVVNSADGTVSVIDPVKMQVTATYPALTAADMDHVGCAGLLTGISAAIPHSMLVDVACTSQLDSGVLHLLNLDNGSLVCTGVAGCGSNGTDISFGSGLFAMASTPDGTQIFLADESQSGGPVGLLNLIANTLNPGPPGAFSDSAASADATVFAANFAIYDAQSNRTAIIAFEPYTDAGNQSFHNVAREKLSASGSLLFYPQDTGVDIFDAHTGRLVRHAVMPEAIPADTDGLALNETATKLFLISNSGITIAQLDEVPLSLATVKPSSGSSGITVTLRGSGFQVGATVQFGGSQAATTFVDSQTLNVNVPALPAGSLRITVVNPDGSTYYLDDAFAVN